MKNRTIVILELISISILSGCATINPENNMFGGGRVTTASANQVFDAGFEGFTDEQLLQLLDPENKAERPIPDTSSTPPKNYSDYTESEKIKFLRMSFRAANSEAYGLAHRSQIQDRIIAASNQRCNLYKTYLKRVNTYTNGIFGTLTTVLGGAGAIVTDKSSARLLSGLAGISSGTRGELSQAIFESLTTSVIIPGIENSRRELLDKIEAKRSKSIEEYTIEGAIADAIVYHGSCSMDTGISYAQKSIQSFEDIGIKRFTNIQNDLGIARSVSGSFTLGSLASLMVAEKALDSFASKLTEHGKKIDASNPNHQALKKIHQDLVSSSKKDGTLRKEAVELDGDLQKALLNYASSTGAEKTGNFSLLEAQQIRAKDYARKIDAKNTEILLELKKLSN